MKLQITMFFAIAISIYALMHLLAWWGVSPLFSGHPLAAKVLLVLLVPLLFSMPLIHMFEGAGLVGIARAFAWVGYTWMGFIFLVFVFSALAGILHLLFYTAAKISPGFPGISIQGVFTAKAILFLVLALCLYGFYEAGDIRVERVKIVTGKLPASVKSITIAQISDVHIGLINREAKLKKIAGMLRELNPGLLAATGDIVDGQTDYLDGISSLLKDLDPPLGKFAILGNHEHYAGLSGSIDFLQRAGFTMLRDEVVTAGGVINVAGAEDRAAGDGAPYLKSTQNNLFTLFLKHRPLFDPLTEGNFDLQLSGHTHRGQIFPFNYITALNFPLQDGLYDLPGGSKLYTSRGTGTWGPPMRVFSPPEITFFEIVPE
ncbi:metallophosphoesterase [bacterium]|nr:MAG: metallophosphoesterase [bacterium]